MGAVEGNNRALILDVVLLPGALRGIWPGY